jgi:hypothetical protein
VPAELDGGGRTMGGWKFNYNGLKGSNGEENMFRSDTQDGDQLPYSRKGKLNGELLSTMGLKHYRMKMVDALFFFQFLLPICDPKKSRIATYLRKPFYLDVEILSQKYAHNLGLVGAYGHDLKPLNLDELVHFDGVLVRDGVRGGSNGAVHRRWELGGKSKASKQMLFCGEDNYHKCEVCKVPLHGLNSRSKNAKHCFIDYYNDGFFGLARGDCMLVNTLQCSWCQPTAASRRRNAAHVLANLMGSDVDDKITHEPPAMLTRRAAAAVHTFPTGRTSEVAQPLSVLPAPAAADDEPEVVTEWV